MHRTHPFVAVLFLGLATTFAAEPARPAYRNPDLPPLLEFLDGTPVRTPADFERRKAEIRGLFEDYFFGSFPENPPKLLSAEVLEEKHPEDGFTRRRVKLVFDTPNRASMEIWVWIPKGEGPFPLLLTQPRFYQIFWAEDALKRGYIACLYPGLDVHHQEGDYPGYDTAWKTFQQEYPEASWQSSLAIQAWLAGRALDYLLDPEYDYAIAPGQVGIVGFSRYGKQSLYAAALDERITAVVARSSGTPAAVGYRFAGRHTFAESLADFPPAWAKASLREFHGRENGLPIEGHGLLALIAPRRVMLHTAYNDDSDPTFGAERTYLEGRSVYRFLGKPENLRLMYRTGSHESGPAPDYVTAEHRKQNLDWFDLSFGRGTAKQEDFPEVLLHQFDWEAWKETQDMESLDSPFSGEALDDADRERRIRWLLGRAPDQVAWDGKVTFFSPEESAVMSHDRWAAANTARMPVSFGENVRGNLYYNPNVKEPVAAVIWLHPFSYATGYNEGYGVEGTTVYHRLAAEGYAVLAFDQCGFGTRLLVGTAFYENYPAWSRFGRMVHDVRAAVDFLAEGKGASQGKMPEIRNDRIYVLGYSLGGMVGLHAAALDERIAGVAGFCGFTPLRTDTPDKPTGGLERFWKWHALLPLLGTFEGDQTRIPYDYEDVLTLIAPRPCLIYAPVRDRFVDASDVAACLEKAKAAWRAKGSLDGLVVQTPDDINRFQSAQQQAFLQWLRAETEK